MFFIFCFILAAGIMRFQLGHPIMARMQEYLASNFDGSVWGANGPLAVTDVLMDACKVTRADDMTAERCLGVTVLDHTAFYAIPYYAWNDIFDPDKTAEVLTLLNSSYALHMWGRFSRRWRTNRSGAGFKAVLSPTAKSSPS